MTRRYVAAAGAVAVALSLTAACGDNGGGGSDELTIWTHTHPPMVDEFKKLIADYEKENNISISYQQIPNTEFGTKMLTALSNGTGPDIINMDDNALRGEYIPKELVAPVDPEAFGKDSVEELEKDYVSGTLGGAEDGDGNLYGVPSEFNATAFAINTAHFRDAGLDPNKPPQTWDDVISYGEKLTAAGHQQVFNFHYIHSGWYTQEMQLLLAQTGGSIVNDEGTEATIDEPAAVEALQLWADLARNSGIADPNTASRDGTAPYQDLATGKQSMAIVYPWSMAQIEASNPDTYKDLKVVPLPQVNAGDPVGRWYGYYMAVNAASDKQSEAWKFISHVAEHNVEWLSKVGFIQPVAGWDETPEAQALDGISTWAEAYANGQFDQVGPHWSEVSDTIKTAIDSVIFDGVEPKEALEQAAEQIQQSVTS